MILETGMKVLIAHRRLFEGDHARIFVGTVEGYEAGLARVTGYTWTRDPFQGGYHRKDDPRTKIVAIASGTVIVYQLDQAVEVASLRIVHEGNEVIAKDGGGFRMDLTEGHMHAPSLPAIAKRQGKSTL